MISKENMEWIEEVVADERFVNRTPAEQSVMNILLAEVKLNSIQAESQLVGGTVSAEDTDTLRPAKEKG